MPSFFQTLDEANVHIDALMAKVDDILDTLGDLADQHLACQCDSQPTNCDQCWLLSVAASRVVDIDSEPHLRQDMAAVEAELDLWRVAFTSLEITTANAAEHTLTRIYFFYLWLSVQTWREKDEMTVDRFEDEFHIIVNLIERYLDLSRARNRDIPGVPAAFSFGTGLVPCICLITIKCRTSGLRQRCIKALCTINLQGIFDTLYLASYLQATVNLEEQSARDICGWPQSMDLQCYQVPEQARLLSVSMYPMLHKGQTDFYKRTSGSLVFVKYCDGAGNDVRTGSSTFTVFRPLVNSTTA